MPTARPDRRAMAVAVLWQGSAMPARPPARRLEWDQVLGWRLRRHHLDQRAPSGELLAVVAEIAGLHAQVMSSAELTLWTRAGGRVPALAGGAEHAAWLRAGELAARLRRDPGAAPDDAWRDQAGAGRPGALPRGAGGRGRQHHRIAGAGRQAAAQLGVPAQARRLPGTALLWPQRRAAGALHPARPVVAELGRASCRERV